MGFIKTSLAVATGILGAMGLITIGKRLSENGTLDKVKERASKAATKAADAVRGKSEKKAEAETQESCD